MKELQYTIPVKSGVKLIRAELKYNLLLPKLVKDLGKALTDDLRSAKISATAEKRM